MTVLRGCAAPVLVEAATLLGSGRRTGRATVGAANALLARVSLEQGKWAQARDRATARRR